MTSDRQPARLTLTLAMLFAMIYPAVFTYFYFLALAGGKSGPNLLQQATYGVGKAIQFGFPIVFVWLTTRRRPRLEGLSANGVVLGIAFGLLVMGAILGLYFLLLRHSPVMATTPAKVVAILHDFKIEALDKYLIMALFYVLIHSLLEEYYWRWFVFGRLRRLVPATAAIIVSSLAFALHHVIVLYVYLPNQFLSLVVPFSLGIAVGGAFWAWLYQRTGSLLGPWLSHLIVDSSIFVVGWDLWRRAL